jgi:hypothetical protein
VEGLDELIETLASFETDPLGFVLWAFPWGEPGPLEHEELETWQVNFLTQLGTALQTGMSLYDALDFARSIIPPVRMARATGHGVGKSALASMLTWWAMSTMVDTKGVVTANTETQLKTKTWPEIAKWHRMFIARDLFEVTATAIFPRDQEHARTWRIDIVPWSKHNTEAFAGLHNMRRRIFVLMDEASAIDDVIHEVTEGAMTDAHTQIVWVMFGNPTKNTGRFRQTAPDGKFGHRWNFEALDSRTVRRTNKTQIAEWVSDYGEDSDFVRVRVKGTFPRADAVAFIPYESVREAMVRELAEVNESDVVLGVDVARFGDDKSVIYPRKGRDARSFAPRIYQGLDTVALSHRVRDAVLEFRPTVVFVDGTGVGGGVVDTLNAMRLGCLIVEVQFGSAADGAGEVAYYNKRAEIWGEMREWMKTGCLPQGYRGVDHEVTEEFSSATYGFGKFRQFEAIQLESKADMKKRGLPSPDVADALACTFAMKLIDVPRDRFGHRMLAEPVVMPDYDPLEAF